MPNCSCCRWFCGVVSTSHPSGFSPHPEFDLIFALCWLLKQAPLKSAGIVSPSRRLLLKVILRAHAANITHITEVLMVLLTGVTHQQRVSGHFVVSSIAFTIRSKPTLHTSPIQQWYGQKTSASALYRPVGRFSQGPQLHVHVR